MIRINEDYFISVEPCEYCLRLDKHKKDSKGNDVSEIIGHYVSLENAIEGARKEIIRVKLVDGDYTLETAIKKVITITEEFKQAIERAMSDETV